MPGLQRGGRRAVQFVSRFKAEMRFIWWTTAREISIVRLVLVVVLVAAIFVFMN